MSFDQRLEWMLLGCAIGFILGYIVRVLQDIKTKVDHVDQIVAKDRTEEGQITKKLKDNIALAVVVLFTVYASIVSQLASNSVKDNYTHDKINLCQGAVETRDVQRALVEAIYTLATGSINRGKNAPPLTRQEVRQYNAYITRVNKFRETMYTKIQPSSACAPYVPPEPDHPPGKPFPLIPITKG